MNLFSLQNTSFLPFINATEVHSLFPFLQKFVLNLGEVVLNLGEQKMTHFLCNLKPNICNLAATVLVLSISRSSSGFQIHR